MQNKSDISPIITDGKQAGYLALTGGALAALALAKYLYEQPGRSSLRISLGGANGASIETWLRDTAEKLQHGSQSMLSELDKKS